MHTVELGDFVIGSFEMPASRAVRIELTTPESVELANQFLIDNPETWKNCDQPAVDPEG